MVDASTPTENSSLADGVNFKFSCGTKLYRKHSEKVTSSQYVTKESGHEKEMAIFPQTANKTKCREKEESHVEQL